MSTEKEVVQGQRLPGQAAPVARSVKIAVMGVTGSGKSTFISIASGLSNVGVGHDLNSCTQSPEPFTFEHDGLSITLVDTPGFNDTDMNESDILKAIADWLDWDYRNKPQTRLNGIIYLQNVMDPRMTGSSLRNLKMFRELCGQDPLKNVLLVTTRWGMAEKADPQQAMKREEQLRSDPKFWAKMIAGGSRMSRFTDTRASALEIITSLEGCEPVTLQIQSELVDQSKNLSQTAAGITVNEEMIMLEKRYKDEVSKLQRELQEAKETQDRALQEALEEAKDDARRRLEKVYRQQDALQYQQREQDRRVEDELQDLKLVNQMLLDKLGAQNLDFEQTVKTLQANSDKLRAEQRIAMQAEIDAARLQPKEKRTGWKIVLKLLPVLGTLVFGLLGAGGSGGSVFGSENGSQYSL